MPSGPKSLPWSHAASPDLLSQAAAVLAREVARLPEGLAGGGAPTPSSLAGLTCPVVGAKVPGLGEPAPDLRQQAHQLLAGVFSAFGQSEAVPGGYRGDRNAPHLP